MCLCEGVCGCQRHWVSPQVESPNIGARNESQEHALQVIFLALQRCCFVFKYKRVEGLITDGRSQSYFGFQLISLTR